MQMNAIIYPCKVDFLNKILEVDVKPILFAILLSCLVSCGGNENDAVAEFCNDLTAKHFPIDNPAEKVMADVFYNKCLEIYGE